MTPLAESILTLIKQAPEGEVFSSQDLLCCGTRTAVSRSLSELCRAGYLYRIERGLYVREVQSRFGSRIPLVSSVLESLARRTGELIVLHGMRLANLYGMTTQMPVRYLFLTTGATRVVLLGQTRVHLQHSDCWSLKLGSGVVGDVARALSWMGPLRLAKNLEKLQHMLSTEDWNTLCEAREVFPDWLATGIEQFINPLGISPAGTTKEG